MISPIEVAKNIWEVIKLPLLIIFLICVFSGIIFFIVYDTNYRKIEISTDIYELETTSFSGDVVFVNLNEDYAWDIESKEKKYLIKPFTLKTTNKRYLMITALCNTSRDQQGNIVNVKEQKAIQDGKIIE